MKLPWGLIAIVISIFIFYYYNQKAKIRREERRNRLKEKRQEYLDSLLAGLKNKDPKSPDETDSK